MGRKPYSNVYNIMLPVWLLVFWPSYLWLLLIPLNYLIDRIVLKWGLGKMPDAGAFCRRHTWKICLAGFASDFVGMLMLLALFLIPTLAADGSAFEAVIHDIGYGIGFNPFTNIVAFLVVALAVAVSGLCIYALDRFILVRAGLDPVQAKRCALRLALITAPYLFFFPSSIIYSPPFYTF
ncbi:Uncharacterised protein [Slackia heliotrinireducens]|uniref:Uncharacterized protein n=1 Tax=Slackia heliotrinireducens (strain ATCC 29202 / DSM 20476 / NCTC 11029 / RHS 1) TaxID=471855 RepID=C7N2W5_SLAHD|nr:hypothetical protein [Slackia heliotrinireducens]ACV21486.1 hypothetical protein Shel_04250 [Slackia heliotrinireducens DSM 20476]VEG98925.1 Uncharacterised protein [Slackia heliotrinireducens]